MNKAILVAILGIILAQAAAAVAFAAEKGPHPSPSPLSSPSPAPSPSLSPSPFPSALPSPSAPIIGLTPSLQVRNFSAGDLNWSDQVSAKPLDIIEFKVSILNSGNRTENNLLVTDNFPNNLSYLGGLAVNGKTTGDIPQGLGIARLEPGQTVTITYEAQISKTANSSIENSVKVRAQNPSYSASSVSVNISLVPVKPSVSPTNEYPTVTNTSRGGYNGQPSSFISLFESVFGPSDIYQSYQGLPKPINVALVVVGFLLLLFSILSFSGFFERFVKPFYGHR